KCMEKCGVRKWRATERMPLGHFGLFTRDGRPQAELRTPGCWTTSSRVVVEKREKAEKATLFRGFFQLFQSSRLLESWACLRKRMTREGQRVGVLNAQACGCSLAICKLRIRRRRGAREDAPRLAAGHATAATPPQDSGLRPHASRAVSAARARPHVSQS